MRVTLTTRTWLALALLALVLVPVLTIIIIGLLLPRDLRFPSNAAVDDLTAHPSRWADRAWQVSERATLRHLGVDVVIRDSAGRTIYRSGMDPLAPATAYPGAAAPAGGVHTAIAEDGQLQVIVVRAGGQIRGTVEVFEQSPVLGAAYLLPAGGLLALVLVLVAIAVFTARAVQRPLAILSRAAHRVAVNDLAVTLPVSPVREIADVSAAFATMGAALSASLIRQAEIEQERRLFISAIVHDLRAPLFSLRGYLEGLEQGLAATPEKAAKYTAICRERADALARLIDDLFTYARLEYLEQPPVYAPFDLGELLRNTAETLHPQLQAKGIVLLWDGPAQPCHVSGDANLLARAVGNLLDNARRYTPEGGTIRVRWQSFGDHAEFTVADSGPGIKAEDVPHLFAPLYRGEGSRNRQTGGAGLGLTIARRILLAHDGDLSVANGPHGGAVFTGSLAWGTTPEPPIIPSV